MKTLVDEIRDMVREARTIGMYPVFTDAASDLLGRSCLSEEDEAELFTIIAERIDREYMELPLDADGVPIKQGDEVYIVRVHEPREVVGFDYDDGESLVTVRSRDTARQYTRAKHEELTHKQPDSLERIDEDAMKKTGDYWGCNVANCSDCPAKVDGKRPMERYGVANCVRAMYHDLLRRQCELAERRTGKVWKLERTCRMESNFDNVVCSACGEVMFNTAIRNYCPNCGAKVVE